MNSEITTKKNIENVLKKFNNQPLRETATTFLNTLGYNSKRVGNDDLDTERFNRLTESALETANPSQNSALMTGDPFVRSCKYQM
ncbi:hypothetical protein F4X88_03235 [Candidatus Poribacteria bacterium]|nr:hypothetical protein [Candidatus Poribacteria bacterium]